MIVSDRLRQHPHLPPTWSGFDYSTSSFCDNFSNDPSQSHDLPLRTYNSKSAFAQIASEIDIGHHSASPASTLGSSPATSNLDYSEPPSDYYMPRAQNAKPSSRTQYSASRLASTQGNQVTAASDQGSAPQWQQQSNAAQVTGQQRFRFPGQSFHARHSSDSTVVSTTPSSPYATASVYPHIVESNSPHYQSPNLEPFEQLSAANTFPKQLPSVTSPTFTDSLYDPRYQPYYQLQTRNEAEYMTCFNDVTQMAQESSRRNRQGLSLLGNSSDGFNEMQMDRGTVPKLDRTESDAYQDTLYDPNAAVSVPPMPAQASTSTVNNGEYNLLSPNADIFSQRLQAASNGHMSARSSSPVTSVSRERSPFKPASKLAPEGFSHANSPTSRLGSAAHIREQQKAEADAFAYSQHNQTRNLETPRTISPKEAMLDYNESGEDSNYPLFPQDRSRNENQHSQVKVESSAARNIVSPQRQNFNIPSLKRQGSLNFSAESARNTPQVPQQYPFVSLPRRQTGHLRSDSESVPVFSPPLVSMESTKSEGEQKSSQSSSSSSSGEIQRPANTAADSGTYTCTYHGCPMRFETPAKLQKHKRDGHRQTSPTSSAAGIGGAVTADSRNSQAGPHRCDRINPSTGKPCNSIFSRPYDLTRHEDTIHNARKQKVRCQFCAEEKTFSRNDALTRHMRVVHPEVDFPGKIKRKGA